MPFLDLTMPLGPGTPVFPGDPPFAVEPVSAIASHGFCQQRLSFGSHFGTHLDAPAHFLEGGRTLTDFPVDAFVGEATVLDVRGQRRIAHDLAGIKAGDMVFFLTGHSDRAASSDFFGVHPVLTEALAGQLAAAGVKAVGIDSFTVDDEPYPVHRSLLGRNILIVENLTNLAPLAGRRFPCYLLPMKLERADGAPCRAVAVV